MNLDVSNPHNWIYRLGSDCGEHGTHKTAHHGHDRAILIGPRAQEALWPFLTTDLTAYLLRPKEVTLEQNEKQRAKWQTPLYPSHVRHQAAKPKQRPCRSPGERYTARVYGGAIARVCHKADVSEWGPIASTKSTIFWPSLAQERENHCLGQGGRHVLEPSA